MITNIGHVFQRYLISIGKIYIKIPEIFNAAFVFIRKAYHQVKAPLSFIYYTGHPSRKGGTYVLVQLFNIQPIPGYPAPVVPNGHLRSEERRVGKQRSSYISAVVMQVD